MAATSDDPGAAEGRETVRLDPGTLPGPAAGAQPPGDDPPRPAAGPRAARAPLALAALATAGWAALTAYLPLPVLAAAALVTAGGGASFGDLTRFGLAAWLLAHGVPLLVAGGPIGVAPLLVTAFVFWRVARAGVHMTRAVGGRRRGQPRAALVAAAGVAVVYGLLGAGAAALVDGPDLRVDPVRAGLGLAGFAAVAALCGAVREAAVLPVLRSRTPAPVADALRTGVVAALLVVAAGAAAGGVALAVAGDDAADMIGAYHAGLVGQAGIVLICLLYAPNLAVWSAAYLVGPGFLVGRDTIVSASAVRLGALPAVPSLAALPSRPASGPGMLLLAAPLAAALVAGWLLVRRRPAGGPPPGWAGLVGAALLSGPIAGVLLGVAGALSGGPLGGGLLDRVGPVWWQVALVAAGAVTVGAVAGACGARLVSAAGRGG